MRRADPVDGRKDVDRRGIGALEVGRGQLDHAARAAREHFPEREDDGRHPGDLHAPAHGARELLWLERREGYIQQFLQSYPIGSADCLTVFSHGGTNAAPIEAALYFVCSEGLANAVKHAGASRISIGVGAEQGRVALSVADDGVGGADADAGSGLRGLADRVEALGGRLHLRSAAGAGTRLVAELPTSERASRA